MGSSRPSLLWVAHASRVLAITSRHRGLFLQRLFRRDAETNTREACATQTRAATVCVISTCPEASPVRITFDEQRAVVGDPQEIKMPGAEARALKDAFEKVILAIEQIGVSEGDKREARSLLLKLLQSKAGADALGEGGAQSLITKYFGSL